MPPKCGPGHKGPGMTVGIIVAVTAARDPAVPAAAAGSQCKAVVYQQPHRNCMHAHYREALCMVWIDMNCGLKYHSACTDVF